MKSPTCPTPRPSPCPASALALLAALLLSACGTPYHPPVNMQADTRFPGLADLLANANGKPVDVLLVHGICSHDASWAPRVATQLGQAMGAASAEPAPPPPPAEDGRVQVIPTTLDTRYGKLRVDALIWSPLTRRIKSQLCYDHSEASAECAGQPTVGLTRARLNARGKDTLVDDCLPDAIIYEGAAREQMQLAMRDAIVQVLAARQKENAERMGNMAAQVPLVVISHSMGSKLLFDTLLRMTNEDGASPPARLARQAVDRLRYLVMAANQIPLLAMADQPLMAGKELRAPAESQDSLQQLLALRRVRTGAGAGTSAGAGAGAGAGTGAGKASAGNVRAATSPLVLVGFTDPNDLLSYTLPPQRYDGAGVVVFNILVSNAPTWLGLLERPDLAHLDYLGNPDVDRLIVCGQPASARCDK
ncbi:hypothetical protein H3H37_21270 [Duganella sp. LX20W]|uniref:Alpha/beta hydrolase n=1 Tax=Rugamonas brunnea TaxID=2758569 RepID=A0A7W2EVX1_9BURK|nr:hypothetical protein [Rugamonas brunnea]MBA5639592.1 hypothetical protein [Rugamonas brunnea]